MKTRCWRHLPVNTGRQECNGLSLPALVFHSHIVERIEECWDKRSVLGEGGSVPKILPVLEIQSYRGMKTDLCIRWVSIHCKGLESTQTGLSKKKQKTKQTKKKWTCYFALKKKKRSWLRNNWIEICRNDALRIQIHLWHYFPASAPFSGSLLWWEIRIKIR